MAVWSDSHIYRPTRLSTVMEYAEAACEETIESEEQAQIRREYQRKIDKLRAEMDAKVRDAQKPKTPTRRYLPDEPALAERRTKVLENLIGVWQFKRLHGDFHFAPGTARLHCDSGPAMMGRYFLNGVEVPEILVKSPHKIKASDILAQQNAEVARMMMAAYGIERFLLDSQAKELDRYMDPRGAPVVLYRVKLGEASYYNPGKVLPLHFLTMLNATLEPDGSRKPYVLVVPATKSQAKQAAPDETQLLRHFDPTCARCAMAWTWGMQCHEYAPLVEA